MPNLTSFFEDGGFREWMQTAEADIWLRKLLEYMKTKQTGYVYKALEAGNTDYVKGQAYALGELRLDILKLMRDTETDTGFVPIQQRERVEEQ